MDITKVKDEAVEIGKIRKEWDSVAKKLNAISYRNSLSTVFYDWIMMCALSLRSASSHSEPSVVAYCEKKYLDIVAKYTPNELEGLSALFADLVLCMNVHATTYGPEDVLGPLFHHLELHNEGLGQFFTPVHLAEAMAEMVVHEGVRSCSPWNPLRVQEPACGSGVTVIATLKALKKNDIPPQNVYIQATDIDERCVAMTYLQLALYGCQAEVIHGNALTQEVWDVWKTPIYRMYSGELAPAI